MKSEHPCQSLSDYLVLMTLCLAVMAFAQQQRESRSETPLRPASVLASALSH